jgi:hypothetical protein
MSLLMLSMSAWAIGTASAQGEPEKPIICFASGTPPDYVAAIKSRYAHPETSLAKSYGFETFRFGGRWSATAINGTGLAQGDPIVLTWSYVPDGASISGGAGERTSASALYARLNGIYGNFSTWHALFKRVFQRWSKLTGITYVYEPNDDGAAFPSSPGVRGVRGDIRIGGHPIDGNYGILAYNYYPDWGDMVIDTGDNFFTDTSNNSLAFRNVIAHEHGHGLGLSHTCPVNQNKLMEPFISRNFDGPQFDDILGAQEGYGDRYAGNDTVETATLLGLLAAGAIVSKNVLSITGDADFFSFDVGAHKTVTIRVAPPAITPYLEGAQNADGSCSSGTLYDPTTVADLRLKLLGSDGTTVLAATNAHGVGAGETLSDIPLPAAGTYFIRISAGGLQNIQAYKLHITVHDTAP